MPRLATALALIDEAVRVAALRQGDLLGLNLACAKGCDACCRDQVIPVSVPEMAAALWHLRNRAPGRLRLAVERRWAKAQPGRDCPFLLDGACAVRPMRFMACRQFNVFGAPCGGVAQVMRERPGQVLVPDREIKRQALATLMPLYGYPEGQTLDMAHMETFIRHISLPLHRYDLTRPEDIIRAAGSMRLPLQPLTAWRDMS